MALAEGRARLIARFGRPMVLRRPNGSASVPVQGYAPPAQVASAEDGAPLTQFICQTGPLPSAFGVPQRLDKLIDGPKAYTLADATPVYEGAALIGWTLIAAGGA